ncbi:RNA polymerase sigma factor [Halobacillus sp. B23F22_1]|uniref:RNA polymerase sigma factor n=1 Tax=Halobacillus sp. B23F22_1 TaxID=3459514 RepID=UPI00373E67E3
MEVSDLYEELKSDLFRFAYSIARHEQEGKDLVQDAWIKSLKEEQLLKLPLHKQKAWFYRVMKNKLIDERRKDKRITEWEEDADSAVPDLTSGRLEMTELLSRLSPDLSDIVFKRYWLNLSSKEIGERLNLPASTVRYKLQTAIKQLRKVLEEDER